MNLPTPVFAGNWKLNHGPGETRRFIGDFLPRVSPDPEVTILLCPPAISLSSAAAELGPRSDILLGVQNIYWEPSGAFTGEISAPMAAEAGARVALVGHSERRHIFGETDSESGRKVRAAIDAGLTAILCVGETMEERDSGGAFAMVERQLHTGLQLVESPDLSHLLIAYEPVWAIGTGRTASPADAAEMHRNIRGNLANRFATTGLEVPILYGGSVSPDNAVDLLRAPGVSGLLVGGASLDPADFARICALRP